MKELRTFFEMTSLSLLPLLVLFLALCGPLRGERGQGTGPAAVSPAPTEAPAAAQAPAAKAEKLLPAAEAGLPALPLPAAESREDEPAPAEPVPAAEAEEEGEAAEALRTVTHDADVTVDILFGSRVESMCLRDYLLGVVASEMPASFEPAALEAQAVAARTDTFYRLLVARPHANAASCTDPGCCKAYLGPEELRRRWGEDYDRWASKIAAAVDATDGEVLTWEGEPIFAAFHACSEGYTEASEDVWVAALPYLRSVPTLETEADVPSFRSTVRFGREELRAILEDKVPGAALGEDPASWLGGEKLSASGRLLSLEAGGVTLSGSAFRRLLGLRSAKISWSYGEDGVFTFETAGYGHGVGLSQYGEEAMARAGENCESILLHYYPGTLLADLAEVFPG